MHPPPKRPLPALRASVLAVAACLGAAPLWATPQAPARAAPTAAAGGPDSPLGCLIEPSRLADVGSALAGVLQRVHVDRGDPVRQGQVLAELRHEVERAQVDLAASHAQSKAELQGALKAWQFARTKQQRTEDLVRKEFVSRQALDQAVAEAEVAQARLAQAREQLQHASRELELARAQLGNRTLRSPISGIVVERFRQEGERVEDKPVLRIATLDPLRVEMVLPATLWGRVERGTAATVQPELASLAPLQGKVSLVDRVIDAASNTFRARLELPNPGGRVPAGVRCSVQFAGLRPTPEPTPTLPAGTGPGGRAAPTTTSSTASDPVAPAPAEARVARFPAQGHPLEGPAIAQAAPPVPTPVALPSQRYPAHPAPVVQVARYPERPYPAEGPSAADAALLAPAPVALRPASVRLAAQARPTVPTPVPEGPALSLALSRSLAATSTPALAVASTR